MQDDRKKTPDNGVEETDDGQPQAATTPPERPREIGGRGGLDPTRYGDWEKGGRCIDF
jgi:hypothetical protein